MVCFEITVKFSGTGSINDSDNIIKGKKTDMKINFQSAKQFQPWHHKQM